MKIDVPKRQINSILIKGFTAGYVFIYDEFP